jgi:FAD/FMN-containing dehydrogenase
MTSAILAVDRTNTILDELDILQFKTKLRGRIVLPCDLGYSNACKVWNGMVDKKPAMIVYCTDEGDVIEALKFARSRDFIVSVRAGGHNVAGCAVCDDGVVIDLSRMKRIEVDPARRIARAQAGLTLGEFDSATQRHGLATTMGVNSDTGIAGLTLGGGLGKLGRKHGLTCDNLIAAEMVTADGRRLRISASEHADLFWGIRGGGGNFGIVTSFEYRLHPIGPSLLAGSLTYEFRQAREAMRFYSKFSRDAPNELSLDAALATAPTGERFFAISVCHVGPFEDGERVLKPLKDFGTPVEAKIAPVPYLQIQSANDSVFPCGGRYFWKAQFLSELADDAIDTLLAGYAKSPAVASLLVLQHVGGAIAHVPKSATAYVNRSALYDCFPIAIWDRSTDDEENIQWVRDLWTSMRPFSTGGVYVNNLGEEGEDRVRAAYGENYARLADLKAKYDPTNLFRLNQNIRPAIESAKA